MKTFQEMNFSQEIKKALAGMEIFNPTPIQEQTIDYILNKEDVIALASTGSGKTIAFGIGAVELCYTESNKVQTVILCPTRELVMQTASVLSMLAKHKEGVRILSIYGGQSITRQIQLLKKKPQIIISTPGRLIDHMTRKTIRLDHLKMLILDEADEMLDMGFREDLDRILKNSHEERQTMLFSATMSNEIKEITKNYQKDAHIIKVSDSEDLIPKITQSYIDVKNAKDKDLMINDLLALNEELTIVFCNTKSKVDKLKEQLLASGFLVEALHGDMRQTHRDSVMRKFKTKEINALITTDVAARGIDVKNVRVVINYDIPNDTKYYIHRIGRTGRAGEEGVSITFVTPSEKSKLRGIEKETNITMNKYAFKRTDDAIKRAIKNMAASALDEQKVKYSKIINEFCQEENINSADFAASLLCSIFGEVKTLAPVNRASDGTNTRLFISIGKLDKITGTLLKKFITENASVSESDIDNMEVFDKFSFFSIKNESLDTVLKKLNGLKYNKRRVGVEISDKPNTKFAKKSKSQNNRTREFDKRKSNTKQYDRKKSNNKGR